MCPPVCASRASISNLLFGYDSLRFTMASICNYSHPELQITEGLTRQTSGILFPYNPEFYKLASGLYEPGTIYCWYLLIISVIINWLFHEKDDKGYRRPGVSNDLLAALAYPAFAATDALIHSLRILRIEYRALAIFCLRFSKVELNGFGTFNHTRLDLRLPTPPEIVTLGQHAIDLGRPLPVCYTFMFMVFVLVFSYFSGMKEQFCWEPTTWETTRLRDIWIRVPCPHNLSFRPWRYRYQHDSLYVRSYIAVHVSRLVFFFVYLGSPRYSWMDSFAC